MKFLTKKTIKLGDLSAIQFIVFEHKRLFSLIFFYFKGDGWQDRFHTHAFNAISFKIFGSYGERRFVGGKYWAIEQVERTEFIRYFPRDCYHAIGPSKGCMTMLIAGPWKKTWKEFKDGKERLLTWGGKEI